MFSPFFLFLPHLLFPSSFPSLPHSLPFSHSLFLFFLLSPSLPPSLTPYLSLSHSLIVSFFPPLSITPFLPPFLSLLPPSFQFPLPEVVVIHRDPSCHEDLRHLKNYILEVHILLPNRIPPSQPDEVIPVTTPPIAHSLFNVPTFSHIVCRS